MIKPITTLFLAMGLTRDSHLWLWSRLVAVAALLSTGVVEISQVGAYIGVDISEVWANRIGVAAVVVLWLAGKYDTSALPGKHEAARLQRKDRD